MRTDNNLSRSFRGSKSWKVDALTGQHDPSLDRRVQDGGFETNGQFLTHSHSGNERNHLFLNHQGESFVDLSTLSGLDTDRDSRGFALLDFDRDGWQDIALVNANAPLLQLFHNRLGESRDFNSAGMIALRFVGGNQRPHAVEGQSARDGYGARVTVTVGDQQLVREHQCGEGFAVQNSSTMIVGIGQHAAAGIRVRWPSGRSTSLESVSEGSLVTMYEFPPEGESDLFRVEPYRKSIALAPQNHDRLPRIRFRRSQAAVPPDLRIYTTMATWCAACVSQYPQLTKLSQSFPSRLEIYGMPVDVSESEQQLRTYAEQKNPPYDILAEASAQDREGMGRLLNALLPDPPLPSTLATDADGRILEAWRGVPTVSDVARLLAETHDGSP